jgi:hypothetical protein
MAGMILFDLVIVDQLDFMVQEVKKPVFSQG